MTLTLEAAPTALARIQWLEAGSPHTALWRSERAAPPPRRVMLADDTTAADSAYRLACEGTGLLWRGDFQNARQLLLALARRIDHVPRRKARAPAPSSAPSSAPSPTPSPTSSTAAPGVDAQPAAVFHRHRQAQSQRARVLAQVLIPLDADYTIPLRRAPDVRLACTQAWGPAGGAEAGPSVVSLRELLGVVSAFEWRKKGVPFAALGPAPDNRIHPHYGVFSPLRGEYVDLVAHTTLPAGAEALAFDVGTGSGVLAAVLVKRGVQRVVATEVDARALACATENFDRLEVASQVQLLAADLFPEGRAALVVCNPPWLPARAGSPIERAIYDEGSRMLLGFVAGLAEHLLPGGEGWLILSDLAEHLGLRTRGELLAAIDGAGLQVLGRVDIRPKHPKVSDEQDPLHAARAKEVTSLWRLGAR